MTEKQVRHVKKLHERELLQLEGVQGVGVSDDQGRLAIKVYVDDGFSAQHPALPNSIDDVPVVVEESGAFTAY